MTARPARRGARLLGCVLIGLLAALAATPSKAFDAALEALKPGGRVLVMRHAQTTPGTGDPAGHTLGDCATQRNLNQVGREQSRRLGEALAGAGISVERAFSSAWCRSLETARLILESAGQAAIEVEILEPLNSLWDARAETARRTEAVRALVSGWSGPGTLLLVSHGVNVRPLVGRTALQGGFFVLRPTAEGFELLAEGRP